MIPVLGSLESFGAMPRLSFRRIHFLGGFLVGALIPLLLAMLEVPRESSDSVAQIINLRLNRENSKSFPTINRPRFYSTELKINEKLLAIGLSELNTIDTFGAAFNTTLSSHVSKLIFYVCSGSKHQHKTRSSTKPSVIHVSSDCGELYQHVLSHMRIRQLIEGYDFILIARDNVFLRGDNLMSLVSHISVTEEVYIGASSPSDPRVCDPDNGILFSRPVLKRVLEGFDRCVDPTRENGEDSLSKCISQLVGFDCQDGLRGGRIHAIDSDSKIDMSKLNNTRRPVMSVGPLSASESFYRLNHFLDEQTSQKIRKQLNGISHSIAEMRIKGGSIEQPASSLRGFKPRRRFDVIRTTLFNGTHEFWRTDREVVTPLDQSFRSEIEKILKSSTETLGSEPTLVNGWSTVDPSWGVRYSLDVQTKGRVKRLRVSRPLSSSELVSVPYVTEDVNVAIVLLVRHENIASAVEFVDRFSSSLTVKNNRSTLLLVTLLENQDRDTFDLLHRSAAIHAREKRRSKIAMLKIRCDKDSNRIPILDIVASRLSVDDILLVVESNAVFNENFLNRVRLHTMKSLQVFVPIPFMRFKGDETNSNIGNLVQKSSGFFNPERNSIFSMNVGDYLENRRTVLPSIPLATKSTDLQRAVYREMSLTLIDFLIATNLHIVRAVEPELHLIFDGTCPNSEGEAKYCHEENLAFLGNRNQLATILRSDKESGGGTFPSGTSA